MLLWNGVTPVQQGGLGAFIRTRRKELGMSSQDDLAEAADVGQKTISNMENDRNFRSPLPPPDVVSAVAKALRVTEAEVIRAAGYLTDSVAARRLDDDGDEWLAAQREVMERLGPDTLHKIFARVEREVTAEMFPDEPHQREMGLV